MVRLPSPFSFPPSLYSLQRTDLLPGVFNYDVGLMPYRRPVNIVVGRPIRIAQCTAPDADAIDRIHARYMRELTRMWDEWKDTFLPDRLGEMQIVQ